jgi:hypothetical protein
MFRSRRAALLIAVAALAVPCACAMHSLLWTQRVPAAAHQVMTWPEDWSQHLGQKVTIEGVAINLKLGATLRGTRGAIWIDGLDAWPDGFYSGGDHGKLLRVTGTVIKRDDLPVFVQTPGGPPLAGIPVSSREEMERLKWRYLLQDAHWIAIDN